MVDERQRIIRNEAKYKVFTRHRYEMATVSRLATIAYILDWKVEREGDAGRERAGEQMLFSGLAAGSRHSGTYLPL